MPFTHVRGINQNYEILGDDGPWIAMLPGGRRGMDGILTMAEGMAGKGYRVLVFDRRNCGKSEIGISGGASEFDEWADDLFELTKQLDAQPCAIGGQSSGCRTAITYVVRHPEAVSGLMLWRVSGGPYAAVNLGIRYYAEYIKAAGIGGMEAVCETDHFAKCIAANPRNRNILMSMDPNDFVEVMLRWMVSFLSGAITPLIGATAEDLKNIRVPTLMFCGNDRHHSRKVSFDVQKLIPESEIIDLGLPIFDVDTSPLALWKELMPTMVDQFDEFLKRRVTVAI
jgi:pimeloyl-ACP methyl ester carboxylesterase